MPLPQPVPCSSCGEFKAVTLKSLPEGRLVCHRCRVKRRGDAVAAELVKLEQQHRRPCATCGGPTGKPRSPYCSGACRAWDRNS